jgi:hypothetical protein
LLKKIGQRKNTGTRKWKWLQELKREREQDIRIDDGKTARNRKD